MRLLCNNVDEQFSKQDPNVFPAEMDIELIKKVPNHVVMTREFDFYRKDAEYYANRLKEHGKLSELYILPGTSHYTKSPKLAADKKKILNHFI